MYFKVALICLLGATSIKAFGEFESQEYPLRTTNPRLPKPMVSGANEYEVPPFLLRALFGIEQPARHLLPPFQDSDSNTAFAGGNFRSPFHQENFAVRQKVAPAVPCPYPYDFRPLVQSTSLQQQAEPSAAFDDNSAVKQSMNDLESNLKLIAKALLQEEDKAQPIQTNINVVFKLDPFLEQFVNMLQLLTDDKANEIISSPVADKLNDLDNIASQTQMKAMDGEDADEDYSWFQTLAFDNRR